MEVRWAKSLGNILVQNIYNFLTKNIILAVWMYDKGINEEQPEELQATGIRGPTNLFASYTGGERCFGLMNMFLVILK